MKSLNSIFKTKKGNIDPESVERYYAHGAQIHESHEHTKVTVSKETEVGSADVQRYGCPMKCEGDKTYDHPGNCPVCNMKLMPVGNK